MVSGERHMDSGRDQWQLSPVDGDAVFSVALKVFPISNAHVESAG
jgi:hypothetical protein